MVNVINIVSTIFNILNENIIYKIINILIKNKWNKIKIKINLCMNLLGFNIINILNINKYILTAIKACNSCKKKQHYIKYGYPLLFNKIKIIEKTFDKSELAVYKIRIVQKNIENKYITIFKYGGVIWDNDIPRVSMMYNL